MTILGPYMAALFIVGLFVIYRSAKSAVIRRNKACLSAFKNSDKVTFENIYVSYQAATENMEAMGYDAVPIYSETVVNNLILLK